MVNRTKNVRFVYVQPSLTTGKKDYLFDLVDWIERFNKLKVDQPNSILMEYDGDMIAARNAVVEKIEGTEYGIIHFVRYRMDVPAVGKMTEEEFDVLELDDDTYVKGHVKMYVFDHLKMYKNGHQSSSDSIVVEDRYSFIR